MPDDNETMNDGSLIAAAVNMPDFDGLDDPSPQQTTQIIDPREANLRRRPVAENVLPLRQPAPPPQRQASQVQPAQNRAPNGQFTDGRQPQQVRGHNEAPDESDPHMNADGGDAPGEDFLEFDAADEGGEPERVSLAEVATWRSENQRLRQEIDQARRDAIPAEEWDRQIDETASTRHQLLQLINTFAGAILPPEPDRRLLDPNNPYMDTAAYYQQQMAYDAALGKLREWKATADAQQKALTDQQAMQAKVRMAREKEKLLKAWPEIADQKVSQKVYDSAQAYGFKPEEIDNWVDARGFAVLRDAMAYREMTSKRQAAIRVVRNAPKLVRTQARTAQTARDAAYETGARRLAQTGSVDDAAMALGGILGL